MLFIFFVEAVPKDSSRFPKPYALPTHKTNAKAWLFFMPSPYGQSMAKPTGSKAASLIFCFLRNDVRVYRLSQPPQSP